MFLQFPQLSGLFPTNCLSDVFHPGFPCSSCWLAVFIWLTFEEMERMSSSVPKVKRKKVRSAYRAMGTSFWRHSLPGSRPSHRGHGFRVGKISICIWCHRTKHCRSLVITNYLFVKSERWHWFKGYYDLKRSIQRAVVFVSVLLKRDAGWLKQTGRTLTFATKPFCALKYNVCP